MDWNVHVTCQHVSAIAAINTPKQENHQEPWILSMPATKRNTTASSAPNALVETVLVKLNNQYTPE